MSTFDPFQTASEWHGGQGSALYSYSSTGEIHGADHQSALLAEIDACIAHVDRDPLAYDLTDAEVSALDYLRYTVECWPAEAV